jgi:hypothetical protein
MKKAVIDFLLGREVRRQPSTIWACGELTAYGSGAWIEAPRAELRTVPAANTESNLFERKSRHGEVG